MLVFDVAFFLLLTPFGEVRHSGVFSFHLSSVPTRKVMTTTTSTLVGHPGPSASSTSLASRGSHRPDDIHRPSILGPLMGSYASTRTSTTLFYRNNATQESSSSTSPDLLPKKDRFERTAPSVAAIDTPCIIEIDNVQYNLTAWARSHPGGNKVLQVRSQWTCCCEVK